MKLTGLHILLTYQCTFECDHCFVWGSPWQSGTLTLTDLDAILNTARVHPTLEWIYFEGGEPFLYYPTLLRAVTKAHQAGFKVGIVSNAYWATSPEDALESLQPFQDLVEDLSISSDLFHYSEKISEQVSNAQKAALSLGIPIGLICITRPEESASPAGVGVIAEGESSVMYRGRAASALAPHADGHDWESFTECPFENLRDPSRIHLDPLGYLHICQGISIGNLFQESLNQICESYDPDDHPITTPLLTGGPAELRRRYDLELDDRFADACHLCYQSRVALKDRFPEILAPDQMYGVPAS
jgi:hypothetical protein